jgi:hypothetical protein
MHIKETAFLGFLPVPDRDILFTPGPLKQVNPKRGVTIFS